MRLLTGLFVKDGLGINLDAVQQALETVVQQDINQTDIEQLFEISSIIRRLQCYRTIDKLISSITGGKIVEKMKDRLFSSGVLNVDDLNVAGNTALHVGAAAGKLDVVSTLLELNADITKQNKKSQTALHLAAQNGRTDVVIKFLDHDNMHGKGLAGILDESQNSALDLAIAANEWRIADILKQQGVDGWKPLLCAAEKGSFRLKHHLKCRKNLKLVLENAKSQMPWNLRWFIMKMISFKRHQDSNQWTLLSHDSNFIYLSEDKLTATRKANAPSHTCVLGSEEFKEGVFVWKIVVDDVEEMWLGIARGVEDHESLNSFNGGDYVFSISNKGEPAIHGQPPVLQWINQGCASFSSRQQIKFKLDIEEKTLTFFIDGRKVLVARNVDTQVGLRPYVCMRNQETASIIYCENRKGGDFFNFRGKSGNVTETVELSDDNMCSLLKALQLTEIKNEEMRLGLDNSAWAASKDLELWKKVDNLIPAQQPGLEEIFIQKIYS